MNYSSFAVLSVILFAAGLYRYKKTSPSKVGAGLFFVMAVSSITLFIAHGVASYFTGNGIDEATIYHLKYGLEGAGFLEYRWLIAATVLALLLCSGCLLWFVANSAHDRSSLAIAQSHRLSSNNLAPYALLFFSLLSSPASVGMYNLRADFLTTDFYGYYRTPHIKARGDKPKNIVFIYAEGLERTYFDETLFPGLITKLRTLEAKSTYFTNIKQVSGTSWTIAGMTASQCGIPLFTPSHGNSMFGMDRFLSSAVCLGDLLNDEGYSLTYIGGANLDFAGKGKLFTTHGFVEVFGKKRLLPQLQDKTYKTGWGLYDDSLLDISYNRFMELSASGEKFGLFTLTLDTHPPQGNPSRSCEHIQYKDGSNASLNAVACSDYLIAKFIKKIRRSVYADKTVVVLASDHLSMRNTAFDLLQQRKRRNLFMIIEPGENNPVEIKTTGSTLDIGPTLLPFIGYTGNIALGRNLLHDTESEPDRLFIHANLSRWKKPIIKFWHFPRIKNSLAINIDKKIVRIDNREFKIPIFIALNDKLGTTLKFKTRLNKSSYGKLVEYRRALQGDNYFLLIDECKYLAGLDKTLGEKGFCLLAGRGGEYAKKLRIDKEITYTAKEIKKLLSIQNRPADATGLVFWADIFEAAGNDEDVLAKALANFGASEAYAASFGTSNTAVVQSLYAQLFGREADAGGLAFYVGLLNSEIVSLTDIASRIAHSATGDDAAILASRLSMADRFTETVAGTSAADEASALTAALTAVDASTASATVGNAVARLAFLLAVRAGTLESEATDMAADPEQAD